MSDEAEQIATRTALRASVDWPAQLDQHGRWLRTVILARSGEPQAVEEIFQEVAAAALAQRAPLSDPAKAGAWLYQLAVRQSLMYRRKTGRRRKLAQNYAQRAPGLVEHRRPLDPLQWLLADERRQLIRQALEQLPPRDAELLLLKYVESWSYQQIANHLDLTPAAVESRLHRARQRMRQALTALNVAEVH